MVKLRKLEKMDIPYMLEWMHDTETTKIFKNNFIDIDEDKAKIFIQNSFNENNQHFAIVEDENEYLGTISLKNIDLKNKNAEYAISTRKKIWGTGINVIATKLILKYAFNELKLHKVYLNVLSNNVRAINFYKKIGFKHEGTFKEHLFINGEAVDLEWYGVINE